MLHHVTAYSTPVGWTAYIATYIIYGENTVYGHSETPVLRYTGKLKRAAVPVHYHLATWNLDYVRTTYYVPTVCTYTYVCTYVSCIVSSIKHERYSFIVSSIERYGLPDMYRTSHIEPVGTVYWSDPNTTSEYTGKLAVSPYIPNMAILTS
jgi:hypothetical protein